MVAVKLNVVIDHVALLANAGRVDDGHGAAVFFEDDVNAIAGGAGDFADNDPIPTRPAAFGFGEKAGDGIDEGALAGVAFADDGDFQIRLGRLARGIAQVKMVTHAVGEGAGVAPHGRTDPDRRAEAQA